MRLLVIGGGSTTVDGPKNDGTSLDVVTGVFKSPVWDSDVGCVISAVVDVSAIGEALTLANRLRCG